MHEDTSAGAAGAAGRAADHCGPGGTAGQTRSRTAHVRWVTVAMQVVPVQRGKAG